MRFNPDYFNTPDPQPDPEDVLRQDIEALDDKYQQVNSLSDLPEDYRQKLEAFAESLAGIIDDEEARHPDANPMYRYLAFQEIQIEALQNELRDVNEMILTLAAAVDMKENKKDGESY
jgi:hypothetical protein